MIAQQVEACFRDVKATYFPRWDARNKWRVAFAPPDRCRDSTGYCDSKVQTIFLSQGVCGMPEAGVQAFLIHEICHDVAASHHNRRWAQRMERAAKQAEQSAEREVAEIVRSHIYSCCGQGVLEDCSTLTVYELAEELVFRNPSISYSELLVRVARYFGYAARKIRKDFDPVLRDLCPV